MRRPVRRKAIAALLLLTVLSPGCVTPGFHGPVPVAPVRPVYGVGFYNSPWGVNYGVWGPRYRVAPFHASVHLQSGRRAPHAFRPARVGRPVPSIPRRRQARRMRRWPALTAPPVQWTYRFDERRNASDLVAAPINLAPAGSRTCLLVTLDEGWQATLVALPLTR